MRKHNFHGDLEINSIILIKNVFFHPGFGVFTQNDKKSFEIFHEDFQMEKQNMEIFKQKYTESFQNFLGLRSRN